LELNECHTRLDAKALCIETLDELNFGHCDHELHLGS